MNFAMVKKLKFFSALALCVLATVCSTIFAFAAQSCTVSELDDMVIALPDDMSAVTRSSKSTDKYFSAFGLDFETTMQTFKNGDIYLQGMDSSASVVVTVTMTKTPESEEIGNYISLSADEMNKVKNNFLNTGTYGSCTPDQAEKLLWLIFDTDVTSGGGTIKAYQANTVYDGMSINITMKRNVGNVTAADYSTFAGIVSSVSFGRGDFAVDILPYVIIGGTVVIVLLVVIIIILAGRAKKRRKHHKNKAVLDELARKYNLTEDNKNNGGYDISAFDDDYDYIEDTARSKENSEAEESEISEENAHTNITDEEIENIINDAREYKMPAEETAPDEDSAAEDEVPESEIPEQEENDENQAKNEPDRNSGEDYDAQPNEQADNKYAEMIFGSDVTPDDEENDEELVRQQARRAKFNSGYDFFEEAPKKTMGVISSEELRDAEDYDVINEIEEKAERIKKSGEKKPNAALVFLKKAGAGLASFGLHFGYFCKNVSIMIKRKRAAAKRRKAEQERRERARQRAQRQRQREQTGRAGGEGLVRVHSRNEQNRRGR